MTDYIPALISLVGGMLAFFFAKSGERNKVGGIGWIMAVLLVGGGVLGLWVLHRKSTEAENSALLAKQEADKAAVAAAKQSAVVMTLVGGFDLKQIIDSVNFLFEHPYDHDSQPRVSPGFTGPLPHLPANIVGHLQLFIGDDAFVTEFRSDGPGRIVLIDEGGESASVLTNQGVARQGTNSEEIGGPWFAGPEPAPYPFTYGVALPTNMQLRRLIYKIVAQEELGSFRVRKGSLSEAQLEQIQRGFDANPPMIAFHIPESEVGEPCESYVHAPLRFVRSKEPVVIDEIAYDSFEVRLTAAGFAPDPCNNNPF